MSFLMAKKGYLLHLAAVAVIFLAPSVQAYAAAHAKSAAAIVLIWGWVLHWAEGKARIGQE